MANQCDYCYGRHSSARCKHGPDCMGSKTSGGTLCGHVEKVGDRAGYGMVWHQVTDRRMGRQS